MRAFSQLRSASSFTFHESPIKIRQAQSRTRYSVRLCTQDRAVFPRWCIDLVFSSPGLVAARASVPGVLVSFAALVCATLRSRFDVLSCLWPGSLCSTHSAGTVRRAEAIDCAAHSPTLCSWRARVRADSSGPRPCRSCCGTPRWPSLRLGSSRCWHARLGPRCRGASVSLRFP